MTWIPKRAVCVKWVFVWCEQAPWNPSRVIRMIAELIEREPEPCAATCCPAPQRPPSPAINR
jgi:hypothetical protein